MKRILKFINVIVLVVILTGCSNGTQAKNQTTIKNRTAFKIDELTFVPKEQKYLQDVKPPNPARYYHYYEEHEGYRYYCVIGKVTNNSDKMLKLSSLKVEAKVNGKVEEGLLAVTDKKASKFVKTIQPKTTVDFYLMTLVKNKSKRPSDFYIFSQKQDENLYQHELIYNLY